MEHEAFVTTVMSVVALLFVVAISTVVTKRIRFPDTVGLVVIGAAFAFKGEGPDRLPLSCCSR